jgi:hypothetical protein
MSVTSMMRWAALAAVGLGLPACGERGAETTPGDMRQEGATGAEQHGEAGREEVEPDGMRGPDFDGRDGAMGMADMCPMRLHDVDLRVQEMDGGVVYTFSGDREQRQSLQRRVQFLGQHYQEQATQAGRDPRREALPGSAEQPFAGISGLRARTMPTEDGARLELTTDEMAEVAILRQRGLENGQRLQDMNDCPSLMYTAQVQPGNPQDGQAPAGTQPGMQPGRPGIEPGQQPGPAGTQPGMQPGQPGIEPGQQPGAPGQQPAQPGMQPGPQPGMQPGTQPGQPGMQPSPQGQPGPRPVPPTQPGVEPPTQPGTDPSIPPGRQPAVPSRPDQPGTPDMQRDGMDDPGMRSPGGIPGPRP